MKNLRNQKHPDVYNQISEKDQKSALIRKSTFATICNKCGANMIVKLKQNSIIWKCPVETCQHSFEEKQEK